MPLGERTGRLVLALLLMFSPAAFADDVPSAVIRVLIFWVIIGIVFFLLWKFRPTWFEVIVDHIRR
jgi:hypothetical protein